MLTLLSLAVSIQWEALGPVRPRGLCRPHVARPRPSRTSSAPHVLGGYISRVCHLVGWR